MLQQTINGYMVKIITDPVGSNVLEGGERRSVMGNWQQDAKTGIGRREMAFDLAA
jgi:hypothetical protein